MKIKILSVFIALAVLAGCGSTAQNNQESNATVNSQNPTKASQKLTDAELEELAKKTDFTPEELKAAAKSLGYKCTFYAVTGSRLKHKLCSTQEQRDVLAEAARRYMQDFYRSSMTSPTGE
jgi:cytochrome c556